MTGSPRLSRKKPLNRESRNLRLKGICWQTAGKTKTHVDNSTANMKQPSRFFDLQYGRARSYGDFEQATKNTRVFSVCGRLTRLRDAAPASSHDAVALKRRSRILPGRCKLCEELKIAAQGKWESNSMAARSSGASKDLAD